MKIVIRTIGLILLATYPNGLAAQVPADPAPATSAHDVMPAAYQQPAVAADKASAAAGPRQSLAAETPSLTNTPLPPLSPPTPAGRAPADKPLGGMRSLITVGGSLTAVLALFFLVAWMLRRASPRRPGNLPPEVFETLGRAPLAANHQVHLLRCGNKLLLVSLTATGAETLTEIADPAEVDRLLGLCRQTRAGGSPATFRQAMRQAEHRHE
jgi:flagellar biogenesis protein FliO